MTDIKQTFKEWKGFEPDCAELLPASGSHRKYYRIRYQGKTLLAAVNDQVQENEAYFSFTRQFRNDHLPVPEIYHICADKKTYFVEDLGDTTLFSLLPNPWPDTIPTHIEKHYKEVLGKLLLFQTSGGEKGLDYRYVYPVPDFDLMSMQWDLNYFKYFFLRLSGIEFSEAALQADFDHLCQFLNRGPHRYFLYRDFQSRNIMIKDNRPWFIDFQGGRKGPLAYDLASLLYDAKAALPDSFRLSLLNDYIGLAAKRISGFVPDDFKKEFYACVLLRILQAMGAYGLRGFHEKKSLFLQSVPYAIRNLVHLRQSGLLPLPLPEIERITARLETSALACFSKPASAELVVHLCSFSFRKGYPPARDEHGGGFVFDCRFLPNPGRLDAYKNITGRHPDVQQYFAAHPEMAAFLQNCSEVLKPAILKYIERNFSSLSIAFGCTGGQHRSVYCAEQTKLWIERTFDVKVELVHLEHPE
ncbi:MAG: phosphotransferase [Bacteroidales bacterium]|nr:phosphotransferase [Bacteroidales bacterium]